MITTTDIENTISKMQKCQELANVHLTKRNALEVKLEFLSDCIKSYCSDLFNEHYENKINARRCEEAGSYDANVIFSRDEVIVTTDDPVSRHPYDTSSMSFKISELLEDPSFKEKIEYLEL